MSGLSARTDKCAKLATEGCFGNRRRALRLNAAVMQKSRDLFPIKTAQHLSDLTGYSVRSCEAWLSGKTVLPADALAALIQSERGREFLTTLMVDSTWRWWLQLKAWWSAIDIAAVQIKQRRKIRELLDDEARATAPQDAAAMLFHDEAFYSSQPSPHRSMVRPKAR